MPALNLLNSFGAKGVNYGLYTEAADVIDTEYLSRYFVVSEFNPVFTAGKNSVAFNGSPFLVNGAEILIECLDSQGNALFLELAKYTNDATAEAYKEATAYIFSVYVFGDTSDGVGKLTLYSTLTDGRTVKWTANVTINKTLSNTSRVRFYQPPILEVKSADIPVLSSNVSLGLVNNVNFIGKAQGLAVTPVKDTNLSDLNKKTTNIDYRITTINPTFNNSSPDANAFNSQMVGQIVTLNINTIQSPASSDNISVSQTSSFLITNVVDNNTLQIDTPYYYQDGNGNLAVTNIVDADISIIYPFVNYNNATASYQTTIIGGVTYLVQQSYADITYKNIRTFSGYVARHKIYRKSLLSTGDFSVIADEPIVANELLQDPQTQNKFYYLLGKFYNQNHINRYWFTSSNNLSMTHTPTFAIDSMYITASTPPQGTDYIMVKNDSSPGNRNAQYIPYDSTQYQSQSGSAYDSNFIGLKANVQYTIDLSAIITKPSTETNAKIALYFTSSLPEAKLENGWTPQYGIKIAEIDATQSSSIADFTDTYAFYTPQNDLYGTLVLVPTKCNAYIKNISFRVHGDDGFSADSFTTRIPWPISVANESFQIKAELFDVNSALVYSDLNTFQSFDPSGSTLIPFIPGGGGYQNLDVSGSLYVSQSAVIEFGSIFTPNLTARPGIPAISQSRLVSVRADGALVFDPIVDVAADNKYIYVSVDASTNRLDTTVVTHQSLTSQYNALGGRKIYFVGGSKVIETSP